MPTYVYRRDDGTVFEVKQKMTDKPLETDPETGQRIQRIIVAPNTVIFKANGFYVTDKKPNNPIVTED